MQEAVRVAKFGRTWNNALVAVRGGAVVGALNAVQWPYCQLGIAEKIKTAPAMALDHEDRAPRAFTMMSRREAHDPHEPHWHIGPIGVRPQLQGKGVGRTLLKTFLSTVDEQEWPAFLETDVDRNVKLYEGFGFTVTGREKSSVSIRVSCGEIHDPAQNGRSDANSVSAFGGRAGCTADSGVRRQYRTSMSVMARLYRLGLPKALRPVVPLIKVATSIGLWRASGDPTSA